MFFMEKMRSYIQSTQITFESWIVSFASIVFLRLLFEQFSSFKAGEFILIDMSNVVHFIAFFLATIVALMLILVFFAKRSIREVSIICIFGFPVILLAPIVDLIAGGIGGHPISYLFLPGKQLLFQFVAFFAGRLSPGLTFGMQLEIILGIIFCYVYVYANTKNFFRAIGAAVVFYGFLFFIGSIPSVIALFLAPQSSIPLAIAQSIASSHIIQNSLNPNYMATNQGLLELAFNKIMIGTSTIIAFFATLLLFFTGERKKLIALIKNSRPERLFYFFLLFIFGITLARGLWPSSWIDIQSYILAVIAFVSAGIFSICQNDIHDEGIDSVSNPDRPLITKDLSKNDLGVASKIFLVFTFLSAYASGNYVLFFTCIMLLIYFVYSNPPLRLKRFVILNSFLVSLACASIILEGFFMTNDDKAITAFPFGLIIAIIIFHTAVSNIRDIKDLEGDRRSGIKTIPVLLGAKNSKRVIAGTICFFFLIIPWYFHIPFLIIPSIIATLLSWYFITQENYKEWKAFVIYMLYLVFIIGSIALK